MKILVTGADGMLGQDLCPLLINNGFNVFPADINNFDITNYSACEKVLKKEKPDFIIHCAAFTDVENAEKNLKSAIKINANGTENIAKLCSENNITLVYISTDYVFDGNKNTPYTIEDSPNPINNYGRTKHQGEEAVKKHCEKYYIIRTSWLYGKNGKNFVNTMLNLAKENREIKVVNDQIGSPTWTVELSNGIIEIIKNKPFGVYHVSGEGEVCWYSFAKEIFSIMDLKVNLLPCSSSEYIQLAKRPKYSVLKNSIKCTSWKESLKKYLLTF